MTNSSSESSSQSSCSDLSDDENLGREDEAAVADQSRKFDDKQLEKLGSREWDADFEIYDISDSKQLSSLTSTAEIDLHHKEQNSRCGKVIWTTAIQIIYTLIYILILLSRLN